MYYRIHSGVIFKIKIFLLTIHRVTGTVNTLGDIDISNY
jgi:hypothetical protein